MSIVKSFSVGEGDMFYIKHGSDNFTMIDCCMSDDQVDTIVDEIKAESKNKDIVRFISTHPDDDHIKGLVALDDAMKILNFYLGKLSTLCSILSLRKTSLRYSKIKPWKEEKTRSSRWS